MILERDVNFFWQADRGPGRVGQDQRLVLLAVDLEKVAPDFADFWKNKKMEKLTNGEHRFPGLNPVNVYYLII